MAPFRTLTDAQVESFLTKGYLVVKRCIDLNIGNQWISTSYERLVFTLSDQPGDEAEVVTVVLTEHGGQTEMMFHQGGGHLDEAGYAGAKTGWLVFFDELAVTLAQH